MLNIYHKVKKKKKAKVLGGVFFVKCVEYNKAF